MQDMECRAKELCGDTWVEGHCFKMCNKVYIMLNSAQFSYDVDPLVQKILEANFIEINPETLTRSTGRTDKNGEKLFGGDKIKIGMMILEIYWCETHLQWRAKENDGVNYGLMAVIQSCEKIGTIYDTKIQ